MGKVIVMKAENGGLMEVKVVEEELGKVIKTVVNTALTLWDYERSDLVVMKDKYLVEVKLPLTKEQLDLYSKFELRRTSSSTAQYRVPVWVVSYNNKWTRNGYVDYGVFIVAPYVDEAQFNEMREIAVNATSGEGK
ncbi:MAG: DUF2286 domain-containing protein [Candidatus Nezhaarchaeales archaeon]